MLPLLPLLLLQVFITPMPLLRLMSACGMPHLKNIHEAVNIMREAMLGVIQVRQTWAYLRFDAKSLRVGTVFGGVVIWQTVLISRHCGIRSTWQNRTTKW